MSRPQKRGPSYATARIPLGRGEGITSLVDFVVISNIYLAYTISDNSKSQNRYFQLLINDESVFFSLVYEKEGIIVLHGEIFTVLNTCVCLFEVNCSQITFTELLFQNFEQSKTAGLLNSRPGWQIISSSQCFLKDVGNMFPVFLSSYKN